MTNPGRGAQQDGHLPSLRNVHGGEQEIVSLLGVGRLQHGHAGGDGVAAVVLFILAGVHSGIIGGNDHQGAGHAGIGDREQRVRGHIQADMFHRGQGARAAERGADGDLQGHLLIGGPLGMAAPLRKTLENLGGRRAGIAGAEGHARVPGGEGDGFVSAQQEPVFVIHRVPCKLSF